MVTSSSSITAPLRSIPTKIIDSTRSSIMLVSATKTDAAPASASTNDSSNKVITDSRSIPKEETKILDLWKINPKADGRGVRIAILDTGCDLAAAGLQTTSEGLPKYIDFLDCTGDGDIDTSKTVTIPEASSNNGAVVIKGKSGRELTLGNWAPKAGNEVRLGCIRLFDFIPRSVKRRLIRERKTKFLADHYRLIGVLQQKLDKLQWQIASCGNLDRSNGKSKDSCNDEEQSKTDAEEKKKKIILRRTDTEILLNQYQSMIESYIDSGPYMDVVMFTESSNDKEKEYKVVIDLKADGNLTESVPFLPFAISRQIGEFGFGSAVTFCIQIYDEGKTLSIVTDAGSHGTHVAGITAANFGTNDPKNGVAPGAQILACKIGDGRLGSAETGTGLIRALIASKKYNCDLINLSYGEPSWMPDSGRVSEVFQEATTKWGMTVFTSAGNDGPALSSLGSPGCLSSPITVGAYVSHEMMIDQYSTLPEHTEDELPDTSYYFSSRGPTPDGLLPDLCAPGGAISPIPRHALQKKAQYHGTSMSSPNACGVAACVLSALKQKLRVDRIAPAELRKGLLNTAAKVGITDPFAQGAGLVHATAAYEYILQHRGKLAQDITIDVNIPERNNARGLYIRDKLELTGPLTFNIKVLPRFEHSYVRTNNEINVLNEFEVDIAIKSSKSWVKTPQRMSLLSALERNGQTFSIRLDVDGLPTGVHYATVDGIDSNDPDRGFLFRLPVTVVIPFTASAFGSSGQLSDVSVNHDEIVTIKENGIDFIIPYKLKVGNPNRRFLDVPPLAEYATIKIRSFDPNPSDTSPHRVMVHAVPFVRGDLPNTQTQLKKAIQITEGMEKEFHLKVKGSSTLEICLQLLWLANASSAAVVVEVEFHSFSTRAQTLVSSQPVVISSAREYARLGVTTNLRSEKLNPVAQLDAVRRTIRPKSFDIQSGSPDRDFHPPSDSEKLANPNLQISDGKEIFNMFLKYEFDIDPPSGKTIKVTPWIPSLFNQLYDSPIDSQLWMLLDSNNQQLSSGSAIHHADAISLAKGTYTVVFHMRHPSRQTLEQLKDVPLELLFAMDSLDCKIYSSMDKASIPSVTGDGREELGLKVLRKGTFQDLYVSRPTSDLPKWVKTGDALTGRVSLDKTKSVATSLPLIYQAPPKSEVKQLNENKLSKDKDEEKSLDETLFESKVSFLSTLRNKNISAYKELADSLTKENSTSTSLLEELLLFAKEGKLESNDTDARVKEIRKVRELIRVSNGGPIDEQKLAEFYGVEALCDDELREDKEAAKLKEKMDEHKKLLKAILLALSDAIATLAISESSHADSLATAVKEMKKWGLYTDSKDKLIYSLTISRYLRLCKHNNGTAIRVLLDARKDLNDTESFRQLTIEIMSILKAMEGTEHLVEHTNNNLYQRFPPQ